MLPILDNIQTEATFVNSILKIDIYRLRPVAIWTAIATAVTISWCAVAIWTAIASPSFAGKRANDPATLGYAARSRARGHDEPPIAAEARFDTSGRRVWCRVVHLSAQMRVGLGRNRQGVRQGSTSWETSSSRPLPGRYCWRRRLSAGRSSPKIATALAARRRTTPPRSHAAAPDARAS